jgi:hypothetical protein
MPRNRKSVEHLHGMLRRNDIAPFDASAIRDVLNDHERFSADLAAQPLRDKVTVVVPKGWPCQLGSHRGLFVFGDERLLCMASAYGDAYIVEDGQAFWGGTDKKTDRAELMVQPVVVE